ncbi:MAG: hypothetical protein EA424_14015 [Planctomycetaceae bacterium]|nr:MAG: hypothetical protein EA424_14015 [Planctomycetaceae bacterium]
MSASNRQNLITKVFKVLKRHYEPVKPPVERTVLEHLLYACCLENSPFEAADEAFARLQQSYFDWNEVRVTTVTELAETLACLADPSAAATRLKRCLQSVFETHYAFDLETLKKQNLGNSVKDIESIIGTTPFVVAYVTQHGLGGHAIPCSQGLLDAFEVLEIISAAEAAKRRVPGLERAVAKAKGPEMASLVHQLGVAYFAAPFDSKVRDLLAEIDPKSRDRVPARTTKASEASTATEEASSAESAERKPAAEQDATAPQSSAAASKAKSASATRKKKSSGDKETDDQTQPATSATGHDAQSTSSESETKKSSSKQLSRKKPR